ncbi:uncharacterized protein AMSG_12265 [Thecamonas trahens ATCC 50062]|uniref:NOD3 protein n=1 Tax=Thecamonas trahens ATCC 50062 TaxID=461836 RepID=A0A0L0DND1_THETB|nr:hypothetical protein AMSG_12265 [Thecamonas trahens ATCC 50062]KNC53765.1 hypothetical protein AMSG_12265 [Thecamonas trahens ATCC 50062]|eukprot:XP_013754378.1 hypothetical protein AMSG_12265 [Thecamonas trahens ATCC 50062]
MVLAIVCMATLAWVVDEAGNTTLYIGLKKYRRETPSGDISGSLEELKQTYPLARKLEEGGDNILGTGIVAIILLFAALIMIIIHITGRPQYRLHWIAIILLFFAGFLAMLGTVLYAKKLNVGYSFILFTFTGPLIFASAVFMLYAIVSSRGPAYVPRKAPQQAPATGSVYNEEFTQVKAFFELTEENMTFCGWVTKTKRKKKSVDHRLLTIGQYRVATWKESKLGSALKLAREGHLLDLASLDYVEAAEHASVNLKFREFEFPFVETLSRGRHIVSLIKNFYVLMSCNVPQETFFGLYVNAAPDAPEDLSRFPPLPKGIPFSGFVEAYEAHCVRAGLQLANVVVYRELLDYIVQHAGDRSIALVPSLLNSFEFLDAKARPLFLLEPFVNALKYNAYFESVTVSSVTRLDIFDVLSHAFTANSTITRLDLSELSANSGFGVFGRALRDNPVCALTAIDLSFNAIKDKGIAALAPGLATLQLRELNLAYCQFGAKGMSALGKALAAAPHVATSLAQLDLSGNKLGSSGTSALANWLVDAPITTLASLNVAETALKVKKFSPILSPEATPGLVKLNLSNNTFVDRDVVHLSNALMSSAVVELDLSAAKVSIESLAGIVGCLVTDRTRTRSVLDLSSIPLKPAGAIRLASSISVGLNLRSLCLDDAQLGSEGTIAVLEALIQSPMIEALSLSRNVRAKDKALPDVVNALVRLVSLPNSPLVSLEILGNSKYAFGSSLVEFFDALASNAALKELNVEGNGFRDEGAEALGAALASNASLETIFIDNNAMSLAGLDAFANGVASNSSIINLPIPDAEFKRIVLDNAGDTEAFEKMRNIIKTLRFAVRFNKTGRGAGWAAPTSLFGDDPNLSDDEWLARDKLERRARRAARRAAKAEAERRTNEVGSAHRASLNMSRANKRGTLSISDFQVEDFMERMGSVSKAGGGAGAAKGRGLLATAARNRATNQGSDAVVRIRPIPAPRPTSMVGAGAGPSETTFRLDYSYDSDSDSGSDSGSGSNDSS